jgi:hypothetical protein
MNKLLCVLALSSAFVSSDALAWGADGHRAVGAIADQIIAGSNAQRHVAALLLPGESLEKIATWPDCVKGTSCGPQTQEMLDYVAANPQHGEYHYTDVPFQVTRYQDGAAGTAPDDIVHTLEQAIAVLQGRGDEHTNPHHFTPRQALILLTHMTGDITQPLHVAAGYVDEHNGWVVPKTKAEIDDVHVFNTRGGNDLDIDEARVAANGDRLIAPPAEPEPPSKWPAKNVHAYWDGTAVKYAMRRIGARTPAQFAERVLAASPEIVGNSGDPSTWPVQWADDTLKISAGAYAGVTLGAMTEKTSAKGERYKVWALTMPDDYPVPSSKLAGEQITKGGIRLAMVLETIWP